jgi:hypothetical protein
MLKRNMKMNSIWRRSEYLLVLALATQAPLAGAQAVSNVSAGSGNLIDIVGDWEQPSAGIGGFAGGGYQEEPTDRGAGPDPGDYAGLPVNDAVRYKAQAYSPDWLTVPEHQCIPHPSTYQDRSPGGLTVIKIYDPVTQNLLAYQTQGNYGLMRTIWMDGRPHPGPNARHTYDGFSTGKWVDDKLIVETTHLKAGWIRRNGVAHSDQARMLEQYVRHDGYMTVISAVDDPIYYSEPFVRSTDLKVNVRATTRITEFGGFVNGGPGGTFFKCTPIDELDVEVGRVPHFVATQEHTELETFSRTYDIPVEAAFGGTETMYPEYLAKLRQLGGYQPGKAKGMRTSTTRPTVVPKAAPVDLTVTSQHVKGKVWMVSAGGQNVAVQIGDEGILVVDPGSAEIGAAVLAEVRKLGGNKPVRQVIVSSSDMHHWHPLGGGWAAPECDRARVGSPAAGAREGVGRPHSKRHVFPWQAGHLLQWRTCGDHPCAVRTYRWRCDGVFPWIGCGVFGSVAGERDVPGHQRGGWWFDKGHDRCSEPDPGHHGGRVARGGRHDGHSLEGTHLRRGRRGRIPRYGHHHP